MSKNNDYLSKFNYNGFKMILQSTQDNLIDYFNTSLPKMYGKENCILTDDFLFAKGNIPAIVIAHLDTVHKELPKDLFYDSKQHVIWSPQGCGGDDRCGVLGALFIAKEMGDKRPSIMFTTDEEIGCVGATASTKNTELKNAVKDIKYAVEIDRKGKDDAVFYGCTNKKFQDYVVEFGFTKENGSNSDINVLCKESSWNMGCVNISSGYYNPHTTTEFIRVDELFTNIGKIINMLNDIENVDKFTFIGEKTVKSDKSKSTKTSKSNKTKIEKTSSDDEEIDKLIAEQIGCDIDDPFGCSKAY